MSKYRIKFMFDWGSGVCLWSTNDAAQEMFQDYPIDTDKLPVSQELKDNLEELIARHDEALDWNNPAGDLLWNEKQTEIFLAEATNAYNELCFELGDDFVIEFIREL